MKDEGTEEGTGVGKRQRWDDRLTIGVDWGNVEWWGTVWSRFLRVPIDYV